MPASIPGLIYLEETACNKAAIVGTVCLIGADIIGEGKETDLGCPVY
jgi:hypothetical protein